MHLKKPPKENPMVENSPNLVTLVGVDGSPLPYDEEGIECDAELVVVDVGNVLDVDADAHLEVWRKIRSLHSCHCAFLLPQGSWRLRLSFLNRSY
jgi:hypothetical protein